MTLAVVCAVLAPLAARAEKAPEMDARIKALLDRTDDLLRGKSSRGKMTMKVVTARFTRELTLEQWSRGKDQFLVRILEPQKERGTATLRNGQDIWNYLPKVERVIKVPASMMGGAWMGSHVTNDDLVKQSRLADDFTARIVFEGARDGRELLEVELLPRPDAVVVWGKLLVRIGKAVGGAAELPLSIDYFDEEKKLARQLTFDDYTKMGGRTLPARTRIVPTDKPGESTELIYQDLEFDLPLEDSFFSLRTLQK